MNRIIRSVAIVATALLLVVGCASNCRAASDGKVFVCKYVGTPGVDERLQTGQNPISVSVNAIPGGAAVGAYFADAQGRSFVLAFDVGQDEPDVSECPGGEPSQSPTPSPSSDPSASPSPTSELPSPTPEPSVSTSPTLNPSATPTLTPSQTTLSNGPSVTPPPTDTAGEPTGLEGGSPVYLALAAIFALATSLTLLRPKRRRINRR